jgi:hypothetical protein
MVVIAALACMSAASASAAVSPTQAKSAALAALKPGAGRAVIVFTVGGRLAAGTVIRQAGGGSVPSSSSARSLPAVQRVGSEPAYFFYEDLGPYQAYQHPGRVALVDAVSGAVSLSPLLSWAPVIGSRLPGFLRSRAAYDRASSRVFTSAYVVAAASRARAAAAAGGPFGASMRPAFRTAQSEGNARTVLAAERSCAVGAGSGLAASVAQASGPLLPVLRFAPTGAQSLRSFVESQAIAKRDCADILISLAGSGYAHASQPTVRIAVRLSAGRLRSYVVRASDLRSLFVAHPGVTFKLLVDAPYSGGFIEALKAQKNVLVIATASGARQRAFRFLASKHRGGVTVRNPQPRLTDSSFTNTQLLGTLGFVSNDAEVSNAIGALVAKRSPSFLAWMIARGFALGEPQDFTADLGQTPRLFTQGFVATAPGSGGGGGGSGGSGGPPGPGNHAPTASAQSVSAVEDTAKAITLSGSDPDGTAVSYAIASNPAHGSLSGAPPNVTYTPASDYSGPDSFTFTVSDGSLTSAPATVSITVSAVDDPPVVSGTALPIPYTEDDPATAIGGAVSVSDIDSANLTGATAQITAGLASGEDVLALPSQPGITSSYDASTGTLTLSGSASVAAYQAALQAVTYRDASENPSTSQRTITFKARDAGGFGASSSTRAVDVVAVNDAPVLTTSAGPLSFIEADPATPIDPGLTLADPDSQIAGATVAVTNNFASGEDVLAFTNQNGITGSLNGAGDTLTLSGTATVADYQTALRSVTYRDTSANPDTSTRTVSFQATDTSAADSNTATRDVSVTASDTPPTVVNSAGALTYTENDPATAIDPGVAVSDPDSADLTGATVQITGNHAAGEDVLSYVQPGGVSVTANAYDSATGTLTLTGSDTVAHYQQALAAVAYANSSDNPSTAARTVTFTARDVGGFGPSGTRGISITAVDDPPTAVNDSPTVSEDSGATPIAVLANDTDPDGGAKTITAKTDGSHGTVAITGGGTGLTYTPDADYCNDPPAAALDTFTYTLNGSANAAQTATVSVDVTCVDDPPTAVNDAPTVTEDSGANTVDVLANDTDIDGGPKTITGVTQPSNGTVTFTGSSVSYTPSANYCNSQMGGTPDTFTYTLNSSVNAAQTATVSVAVTCVDDPPVAVDDSATVTEDAGASAVDVLVNDTDIDGGAKTITAKTDGSHGTVAITGGGTGLTYTPNANYCNDPPGTALDTFTYTLNGSANPAQTATVSVDVTCEPDPPVITTSAGSAAYTEQAAAVPIDPNLTLADPDTPPDQVTGATVHISAGFDSSLIGGDLLTFANTANITGSYDSTLGTLTLTGTDTIANYQLALRSVGFSNGSDNPTASRTITFKVTDTTPADSNTATKTIAITAVDDPPVAVDDSATVTEDDPATAIAVLTNDTDVDGGAKTITGITQPFNGTVAITGGGSGLTYKPAANYCNNPPGTTPDTFTYTLNSSANAAQTATVSITVTCVNDAPTATDQTFTGSEGAVHNTDLYLGTTRPAGKAGKQPSTSHTLLTGSADVDGPGPLQTVAVTGEATTGGGTVDITTSGTFTYHPPAGCSAASDTFSFTVTDQNATPPGPTPGTVTKTATVNLSGCVWYADSSKATNGNGTANSPFNTLAVSGGAGLNGAGGAGDSDSAGDTIFLFSGTYTGGLPLENTQTLVSQRAGLVIGGATLFPAGGTNAKITNAGGSALTLANSDAVQGVDLGDASLSSLAGAGYTGTATIDTVTDGSINNTTGRAVDISNAAVSAAFTSVSSSGSATQAINLATVTGTFNASGGTLANATGDDIDLSGGTSAFTYAGAISDTIGTLVSVSGETGGTKTFSGAISDGAGGSAGVSLTNNTGATINLTGGVTLSTGANPAFTATGGGTINVTDPNAVGTAPDDTLTTTTATALNVANTTIGASNLNFKSITAGTAASGPAAGIVLNNTGSTGGLTVTGSGSTAQGGDNSGGTIQKTTGDGVSLTSTKSPSLTNMRILNTSGNGVGGTHVTGFTFANGTITGAGDANQESAIAFNGNPATDDNIDGVLTVTGNTLTNSFYSGLDVQSGAGTVTNANVSNNTITNTTNGEGVNFVGVGSATSSFSLDKATIANNVISNTVAGIQVNIGNSNASGPGATEGIPGDASNIISITGNQASPKATGVQAIIVTNSGANSSSRTRTNFDVSNNGTVAHPLSAPSGGTVILIGNNGYVTMTGTVDNNVIDAGHTPNTLGGNGIAGGNGIVSGGETPDLTLTVDSNSIKNTDGNDILLVGRGTAGIARFTITNNNVAAPIDAGGTPRPGIRVDAGNTNSTDDNVCLTMTGNTSAGSNGSPGLGIRKQGTVPTTNDFGIHGLSPSPATIAQATAFIDGLNPAGGGVLGINGDNYVNNTAVTPHAGFAGCS